MGLKTLLDLKNRLPFLNELFAFQGDENLLQRLFKQQHGGAFVDIGSPHPVIQSNTYAFYKMGWRGININAAPGSMQTFKLLRPEDINLEISVSDHEESLPFFIFNEPAVKTLSYDYVPTKDNQKKYPLKDVVTVQTKTLASILERHLQVGQPIRFLAVNAEGNAHKILLSNNWIKYRPEVVVLETELSYTGFVGSVLNQFMVINGYQLLAKTASTVYLKDINTAGFVA